MPMTGEWFPPKSNLTHETKSSPASPVIHVDCPGGCRPPLAPCPPLPTRPSRRTAALTCAGPSPSSSALPSFLWAREEANAAPGAVCRPPKCQCDCCGSIDEVDPAPISGSLRPGPPYSGVPFPRDRGRSPAAPPARGPSPGGRDGCGRIRRRRGRGRCGGLAPEGPLPGAPPLPLPYPALYLGALLAAGAVVALLSRNILRRDPCAPCAPSAPLPPLRE